MTDPLPLRRWVIDTNVLVSGLLRPRSVPAHALLRAIDLGRLLFSKETHGELLSVIRRPKFDRYVALERRLAFLVKLDDLIDWVTPTRPIRACRDSRDDKFLDVTVHGSADALITGDADLLALHPFHDVPILTPEDFLANVGSPKYPGIEPGPAGLLEEARPRYRSTRKISEGSAVKA
jgi:putative PIN family toxin of toxin-antitoxin system